MSVCMCAHSAVMTITSTVTVTVFIATDVSVSPAPWNPLARVREWAGDSGSHLPPSLVNLMPLPDFGIREHWLYRMSCEVLLPLLFFGWVCGGLVLILLEHLVEFTSVCIDLFLGAPKSLQMVTAAMKLKDTCSLEETLGLHSIHSYCKILAVSLVLYIIPL